MAELSSSYSRGAKAANRLLNYHLEGSWENRASHIRAALSASTLALNVGSEQGSATMTSRGSSRSCKHRPGNRCLRSGHFSSPSLIFSRAYSGNGTREVPLYRSKTAYYEILQVSSTSSQAQIKTAYYRQSFIYHPDRNAGSDEATAHFSEISEAYTVLGNKGLRKKYDRGLLSQMDLTSATRPSTKEASSTKSQTGGRQSVMGRDTAHGVYDFDQFYKSHYGEQLKREKDLKFLREELAKRKRGTMGESNLDNVYGAAFMSLIITFLLFFGFK